MNELDVLLTQLEELLGEGAVDTSDALEIATCAGLASRMGAAAEALQPAEAWRAGPGGPLLEELWSEVAVEEVAEDVDGLLGANADEDELEETFFDFDDLVAAAVWCGQRARVVEAAKGVARTVRMAPEVFAPLAPYGVQMSCLSAVGQDLGLYDYWLAIADCSEAH